MQRGREREGEGDCVYLLVNVYTHRHTEAGAHLYDLHLLQQQCQKVCAAVVVVVVALSTGNQ